VTGNGAAGYDEDEIGDGRRATTTTMATARRATMATGDDDSDYGDGRRS
jgi:hypothetical protein